MKTVRIFVSGVVIAAITLLLLLGSPAYRCLMSTSLRRPETVIGRLNHTSIQQTLALSTLPLMAPHRQRIQALNEGCRTLKRKDSYTSMNVTDLILDLRWKDIIVNSKYKIMFCLIPKAGATNWRRAFLELAGTLKKGVGIHDQPIKLFRNCRPNIQKTALTTYTKIMFVRHPFERLLSAYLDKFIENPEYSFLKRYGKYIRYSPDGNGSLDGNLSFGKFVNFLLAARPQNRHWDTYFESCDPCRIKYDFIGKFDTLYPDIDYLSNALHVTFDFAKTARHATNSSSRIRKFYSLLTREQILGLYRMYYDDFMLFGFPYPDLYLNMAVN
ncbi:carbohydrate sulfotransferase 11-like [Ptychodera flava]|uniref:carbohydrate sulfotransferase 11-like n=1 Tax=Ptychodera flava TaxID=63121 RepID=UPI003969D9B9